MQRHVKAPMGTAFGSVLAAWSARRRWIAAGLALAMLPAVVGATGARAQEVERIAAVVNEDVISSSDLSARLGLALLASGLPATEENREQLRPQVLRTLIDETLQRQEAARFDIAAPEEEVEAAFETIARNNGTSTDALMAALDAAGVPRRTLEDQIRTTLAWRNLIRARLLPQVDIADDDIDAYIDRMSRTEGLPEYLVAEIFLEAGGRDDPQQVIALARQLGEEIAGGANFAAVARQFSQSSSAARSGDLGWVMEGQLAPELDAALADMAPGQLSPPVEGPGGVYLLLLRDRRLMTAGDPLQAFVEVASLTVRLPSGATQATADRMMAEMQSLQEQVRGCDQLADTAASLTGTAAIERQSGRVADLPEAIAGRVVGTPVGQPTSWQPLETNDGATTHMVCRHEGQSIGEVDREQIRLTLGEERVDRLARRYLRDLRNEAYIELRG